MNNRPTTKSEIAILEDALDFKEDEIIDLKEQLERLKGIIDNPDRIAIYWHVNDILVMPDAKEHKLTRDEARKVLALAKKAHDACEGINWGILDIHIKTVVKNRGAQS